ncbi:hypothetical protein HYPSUDRAFT_209720 [Hypholoma sublateritium FD-334 SS-4]|uniref:Uncharacterized protein n=1 Tax=Hypholoma sublateritium (strain FD-334 SS-4) TaxID=945553 RepID=A0A0D2KFQ2_HYPSF|nr:hypothetical protein HYPSUDRAFT_209720 [Hypholoma sublateritium FD-334 SS-4]
MYNYDKMLADAERAADDGVADHADDGDADEEDNADRPIELPTKQDKGKGRAVENAPEDDEADTQPQLH